MSLICHNSALTNIWLVFLKLPHNTYNIQHMLAWAYPKELAEITHHMPVMSVCVSTCGGYLEKFIGGLNVAMFLSKIRV